jgi:hypothetical protein
MLMFPSMRNFSQGSGQYQETLRLGIGEIKNADWNPTQNKIAVSTNLGVYLYNEAWQLLKFTPHPQFPSGSIVNIVSEVRWSHDGNHLTLTREIDGDVDGDIPAYETVIFNSDLNVVGQTFKHLNNTVVWSPDSMQLAIRRRNGFKIWNREGQHL